MNRFSNIIILLAAVLIYVSLWIMLQPVLGYNLDSDCVAYLTLAERVAKGDYLRSINGLWSPLNVWFTALLIRNGHEAWWSAKILNVFFGGIVLVQSYFLLLKFSSKQYVRLYLMFALSIAIVYFVYFQMFGDVLQLIFLLAYLHVLWRKQGQLPGYAHAILCGCIMALAYYAKAYSFFFFALHFLCILLWAFRQKVIGLKRAIGLYSSGLFAAILLMLPWSFALQKKYHQWSLSGHAGKLNMSWYINSGKSFRSDITLLIPPVYDDSPSFWEDPWLTQQDLSSPLQSAHHFVRWIFRVIHTLIVCVFCFQEISFAGLALLILSFFYLFYFRRGKAEQQEDLQAQWLCVSICTLPLGYLMMHIETRYIWLNVMLLMALGAFMFERFEKAIGSSIYRHLLIVVFALSFILFPVFQFENLKFKNKDLFDMAEALNKQEIKGKFTSPTPDAGRMWVIAYLTKSNFYTIERSDYTHDELLKEMKRYGVHYYFLEKSTPTEYTQIAGMKKKATCGNLEVFEISE